MTVIIVPRTYKVQKIGRAYYVAIPKSIIRKQMILNGVNIEVLEVEDNSITLKLRAANVDINREHGKGDKES